MCLVCLVFWVYGVTQSPSSRMRLLDGGHCHLIKSTSIEYQCHLPHKIDAIMVWYYLQHSNDEIDTQIWIHDDVIKWKYFPRYWPFVRGIHRSPVNSPQRPVTRSFDVFFDLRLHKRLSKQSWGWWFETPSWSLWRHCNVRNRLFIFTAAIILSILDHPLWVS